MISTDIKFYHSGGGGNCNPALDLGGAISSCQISPVALNNLFPDTDGEETLYRCIYIKNTHATETLRNVKIYIDSETHGGAYIDMGMLLADESQKVTVDGEQPPNESDYMLVTVPTYISSARVDYHPNPTIWQGRFQNLLDGVDGLNGTRVSMVGLVGFPTAVTFTVNFKGQARSRDIQTMTVSSFLNAQTVNALAYAEGAPVNRVAPTTTANAAPTGVRFNAYLRGSPALIGDLRPGDYCSIWFCRTASETFSSVSDGFVLRIDGVFP